MNAQQQSGSDNTTNFFWLFFMLVMAVILIWFFKPGWIIAPIYYMRYVELILLNWVLTGYNEVTTWYIVRWFHLPTVNTDVFKEVEKLVIGVDYNQVKFDNFAAINRYVGSWMRFPIIAILIGLAIYSYYRHQLVRFRQSYSMKSLKQLEVEVWPQITPVVSIDLIKEDIQKGPWAMAKTPLDFAKSYNCLLPSTDKLGNKCWTIDEKTAGSVFSMQLGRLYMGLDKLPIYVKALVVIFCARADKDHKTAKVFLSQIARSSASGKLDFKGVEEALEKYKNTRMIQWVEQRHAYTITIMATLLELGRTSGVLASSEFLWLKPVDRKLWYMLNTIGRQTSVTEISGAFSHWLAEKRMKRPLKTPMTKQAVVALKLAVEDVLYVEKGDLWHSKED